MRGLALGLAVAATVCWGGWSYALDRATEDLPAVSVLVVTAGVTLLLATGYALATGAPLVPSQAADATVSAWQWAALAGLLTTGASLLYYTALGIGRLTPVTTVTSLYFVVTACLAVVVVAEPLDPTDLGALGAAVAAVLLFNL